MFLHGGRLGIHDVDVDGVYERRPRPLCPPHLITLRFNNMLRFFIQTLATTSGSLQLCFKIIHNILIMPEFIQPCFKRVSSISRHNPVWQTVSYIHHHIFTRAMFALRHIFGINCAHGVILAAIHPPLAVSSERKLRRGRAAPGHTEGPS